MDNFITLLILYNKKEKCGAISNNFLKAMKGRKRSSFRFANRVQQKCIYFPQNTNTNKLKNK
jgi:hypothetical protein